MNSSTPPVTRAGARKFNAKVFKNPAASRNWSRSQAADWLLQKGHGVDETTPAVEQPKVDDVTPY
jgi:hypothetical protein